MDQKASELEANIEQCKVERDVLFRKLEEVGHEVKEWGRIVTSLEAEEQVDECRREAQQEDISKETVVGAPAGDPAKETVVGAPAGDPATETVVGTPAGTPAHGSLISRPCGIAGLSLPTSRIPGPQIMQPLQQHQLQTQQLLTWHPPASLTSPAGLTAVASVASSTMPSGLVKVESMPSLAKATPGLVTLHATLGSSRSSSWLPSPGGSLQVPPGTRLPSGISSPSGFSTDQAPSSTLRQAEPTTGGAFAAVTPGGVSGILMVPGGIASPGGISGLSSPGGVQTSLRVSPSTAGVPAGLGLQAFQSQSSSARGPMSPVQMPLRHLLPTSGGVSAGRRLVGGPTPLVANPSGPTVRVLHSGPPSQAGSPRMQQQWSLRPATGGQIPVVTVAGPRYVVLPMTSKQNA
ncbi:unnamed protein product [Polarella glacialis]|uniref:Uncharacterized protein n=2 Tax=Polarella glacialis TaxID=89957 RepID=A0A813E5P7_POLGL|nr:unnamed protein product [Polarella glacialis]